MTHQSPAHLEGSAGEGAAPEPTPPEQAPEQAPEPPAARRFTEEQILRDRAVNTLLGSLRL